MSHYYGFMYDTGANIAMIILWILLIVAVIWIIAEMGRRGRYYHDSRDYYDRYGEHGRDRHYADDALRVLSERYAKGEITKEEYVQKKKDILG